MKRDEVERWLEEHPAQVHGVPHDIIESCEKAVRKHAAEDAWEAARTYVEGRLEQWEHQWGFHASEASVAKEICIELARQLERHEPGVEAGAGPHLAGEDVLGALEPQARGKVIEWVCELAREVEHRIWGEIVSFTKQEGRKLVRSHEVSEDGRWDATRSYADQAAHVAQLVLRDYERQAKSG
jgi:hypothetical protein